ncbi:hypothetical protein Plhal710r2_c041g0142381 [Plasmopara halstedii]
MSASYFLNQAHLLITLTIKVHSSIWKANRAALTRDEDCATAGTISATTFAYHQAQT